MAALILPDAAWAVQDVLPDDIVVVGRKMRRVRLNYASEGRLFQFCVVGRSSGTASIDRAMCAMLRTCVRQGHADKVGAQRCVDRRLDAIIDGREGLGSDVIVELIDDPRISAGGDASATGGDAAALAGEDLVEGRSMTVRGGLWEAERNGVVAPGGGGMPVINPSRFAICLPDTTIGAMLERAVAERRGSPGMADCGPLRLVMEGAFADLRLSCKGTPGAPLPASLDTTHGISVSYAIDATGLHRPGAITAIHTIALEAGDQGQSASRRGTKLVPQYGMQATFVRTGDCPATPPVAYAHDGALPMMFGLHEVFGSHGRPLACPRWTQRFIPRKCTRYLVPTRAAILRRPR